MPVPRVENAIIVSKESLTFVPLEEFVQPLDSGGMAAGRTSVVFLLLKYSQSPLR